MFHKDSGVDYIGASALSRTVVKDVNLVTRLAVRDTANTPSCWLLVNQVICTHFDIWLYILNLAIG